jgi:hypothetical protein
MTYGVVSLCKGRLEVYEYSVMVFVFIVLFVLVRIVCIQIKNMQCTSFEAECQIHIFIH